MTDEEQIETINQRLDAWNELINQGVDAWNKWRGEHRFARPDLMLADLSGVVLSGANLSWTNLEDADLSGANLSGANLRCANLTLAHLNGANLTGADLRYAQLLQANLENANLSGCRIYGISAWDIRVNEETKQSDLIITRYQYADEPVVTVDNLEVAQF